MASATITFPWVNSSTSSSTITVRGVASSSAGVARVLVGDVIADTGLAPVSTSSSVGLPRLGGATPGTGLAPLSTGSPTEVEFSVEVTLEDGVTELSVTVEDDDGNSSDELDSVLVALEGVPDRFTLDAVAGRLIGPSFQASVAADIPTLVNYNFIADAITLRPSPATALDRGTCFIASQEWFVYATTTTTGNVAIDVLVLDSPVGFRAAVLNFDPGPEWGAPNLEGLACAPTSTVVHVLQRYPPADGMGDSLTVILAVDLEAETVTELARSDPSESPGLDARGLVRVNGALILGPGFNQTGPLWRVDVATGERTSLTPGRSVPQALLAPDLDNDRVFLVRVEDITVIDLAGTEDPELLSSVARTHPFHFDQPRDVALDAARNRLLVADDGLEAIIAIDLDTGDRSELLARTLGEGPRLIDPRQMVFGAEVGRFYVADWGGNAAERLIDVDVMTGERRVAATFEQDLVGLALDEASAIAYVAYRDRVFAVDLNTDAVTTVAQAAIGSGAAIGVLEDLLFDPAGNRLLMADSQQEAILALDPGTGVRSVLSQAGQRGEGPAFENINSLSFGPDPDMVFVTNQLGENVMRVDLASGDREIVPLDCADTGPIRPEQDEGLQQVVYHPDSDRLLVLGNSLVEVHPETGACRLLPQSFISQPLRLLVIPTGQVFAAARRAVTLLDLESGEFVIVSK
ncbi:MAG: hypothetical protein JJT88_16750 [Gammaproteobacteria bacterium]|nr:hypothetical protein [Gammaproteobacteria bacterium]